MKRLDVDGEVGILFEKLTNISCIVNKGKLSIVSDTDVGENPQLLITQNTFTSDMQALNSIYFAIQSMRIIENILYENGVISILPKRPYFRELVELVQELIELEEWGDAKPHLILVVCDAPYDIEINLDREISSSSDAIVYRPVSTPKWKFWQKKEPAPKDKFIMIPEKVRGFTNYDIDISDYLSVDELWLRLWEEARPI